ncbi:hypothetical protein [Streptomyces griseorubiginosus]|uniref:hypothetical protein n=1 Tax=Streptomyces griseorubiginosus TaxID=67304 RepID=UPI0027E2FEFE|nr:hypothetical protein [Streptomyces griseorubiginosus]
MIAPEADPEDPGPLGPGAPLVGPLVAGALTVAGGGGALLVTLPGVGGGLVVVGPLGGAGATVVAGLLVGGPALVVAGLPVVCPAPAVDGGALDGGGGELGGWELGGGLDGGVGAEDGPGPLLDPDDGGVGGDG